MLILNMRLFFKFVPHLKPYSGIRRGSQPKSVNQLKPTEVCHESLEAGKSR